MLTLIITHHDPQHPYGCHCAVRSYTTGLDGVARPSLTDEVRAASVAHVRAGAEVDPRCAVEVRS